MVGVSLCAEEISKYGKRGDTFFGVDVVVVDDGVTTEVFGLYAGEELGVYSSGRLSETLFCEGHQFLVAEKDEEFFVVDAEDDFFL